MARAEPQPPEGGTTNAKLFDSGFDRVGGFAVHRQSDADFAAPRQRRRQPNIALIQTDKFALRSGKQNFDVRAIDRHFDVVQSAVMAKALLHNIKQQWLSIFAWLGFDFSTSKTLVEIIEFF